MNRNPLLQPNIVKVTRDNILPKGINSFTPTPNGINAALPGQKQGWSVAQTQEFINNSVRTRGFITALSAGAIQPVQIQISGTAKLLIGFVLHAKTNFSADNLTPRAVSLVINNETVVQEMPFNLLDIKFIDGQFYEFIRPLSGNDSIELIYDNTGQGAQTVEAAFYYR